mgnify:CR=1 FL=1
MKYSDLENILHIIEDELDLFEKYYSRALESNVKLIQQVGKYIAKTRGKRLRPALLLLCAKYFGKVDEKVIEASTIVELLHTATLIHDDVVDKSNQRRGRASINHKWENKIAVLIGDFLFSRSLTKLTELEDLSILRDIARTTEDLSSGELLQIEKSQKNGMTKAIYDEMIFYKTASLFATSCCSGAKLMGADQDQYRSFYNYGKYLGKAFQIKDDLFDISGKTENTGKPVGQDVKQNILTLPIIYTIEKLGEKEGAIVKDILKNKADLNLNELTKYVKKAGGFKFCNAKVDEYSQKAKESLRKLENNEIINVLLAIIDFNQVRNK